MSRQGESEDPRRRLLIQLLAAGAISGASASAMAQLFGGRPTKLAAGRSIYRLDGTVTVDGKPATVSTNIGGRATIETGRNSEVVYAVGQSAFILRGNSKVTLETAQPDSTLLTGLRLLSGKLLSVFAARKPMQLKAATATIGIRGTGVYMEADPEQTYFCTCYGVADVQANGDPESQETIAATHHDKPLYIVQGQPAGRNIRPAPFINHTDQELQLVEALVGREPPFVFPKADYSGPRRGY
ncbi:MAG: FecR domain-containing protein [Betaproteobacteria bacterium]|nr:FecR domain-containing protein [Betaproteobacteria bacterium]